MNRFLRSRLCRCCVCLILVLVLLISWSPIKAQASVLGGTAVALFGDDAIAILLAVLGGLGVCAVVGSEESDLEARALARNAMDAMEGAGSFVKDGALTVYKSATAAWSYAVSTDMVQWLHNWLFSNEELTTTFNRTKLTSACSSYAEALAYAQHCPRAFQCVGTDGRSYIIVTPNSSYVTLADGTLRINMTYTNYSYYNGGDNWISVSSVGYMEYYNVVELETTPLISSKSSSLNLGVVAPPGTVIRTEYGQYVVEIDLNGRPETGGDGGDGGDEEQPKIEVMPVPLLPPSEIPNIPQKDIWKGNKVEIENPDTGDTPDPTTGTDTDDPDSGSNNPTTPNPDPGTNPGTGVPSDIGKYQIDLKDFFPFCIPFDLYRFIEILCAEPEAPVFHWEFNVFGELHSLDVDLSPWNPHAQLFRDAQVGLFIMGLLWITRKFIKW